MTPVAHVQSVVAWFRGRIVPKYMAGHREHGGDLTVKAGVLSHLEDEILDAVVYMVTAKAQIKQMAEDGKTAADVYRFLFRD